jgi:3-hydroxy-9,10-secoandrosta-1,3,5(10)-triene-9,17-dione monooxygenase reductase component
MMSDSTISPGDSAAFDSDHFRTVLGHFPTGVTVVTGMAAGDRPHGFTIGSFTSVSLDPPLVGFLPQVDSETWALMAEAGSFCVNVLSDKQSDLCWKFAKSGTETTRFDGVKWHQAPSGSPVIDRAVAWIDCSVEDVHTMGDHYFVLGRVIALDADADHDGLPPQPLVFYRGTIGGISAEG